MRNARYYPLDGKPVEVPHDQIDAWLEQHKNQHDGVLWLEISDAQEEDFQMLKDEFAFHPLAMEDLRQRDLRPRVAEYGDYIFLVAHEWQPAEGRADLANACLERRAEINAFVGPNYVVTVHTGDSAVVKTTRERWEANGEMRRQGPFALLYLLLDSLVDDYFPALDAFDDRIDTLEEIVLQPVGREEQLWSKEMRRQGKPSGVKPLEVLLSLRRDLLEVRRYITPLRDAVNVLLRRVESIQDDERTEGGRRDRARALFAYFQDVYDHTIRIVDTLDTYRDLLSGTLDAHLAVASNRLNEIVKVLTSVSMILMTWATITGIYGMNFEHMPELHWRYGYGYALGLMAVTGFLEWIYFRRRRWI